MTLVVFASQVHSNTLDFEVREVMHAGTLMRGVFARRDIAREACPIFVGTYPGRLISTAQAAFKRKNYALRHTLTDKCALQIATAYNRCADEIEFDCELDPTDANGNLLPEFSGHIVCYINEPPSGHPRNAGFVFNEQRNRYEVWLQNPVLADGELHLCYGRKFHRNYPVSDDCCARSRLRFIRPSARLILDPRTL